MLDKAMTAEEHGQVREPAAGRSPRTSLASSFRTGGTTAGGARRSMAWCTAISPASPVVRSARISLPACAPAPSCPRIGQRIVDSRKWYEIADIVDPVNARPSKALAVVIRE